MSALIHKCRLNMSPMYVVLLHLWGVYVKQKSRTTSLSVPHITCDIYIHTHVYVYICIYMCICVHMHTCICVDMHTYVKMISLHHVRLRRAVVAHYRHIRISIYSLCMCLCLCVFLSAHHFVHMLNFESKDPDRRLMEYMTTPPVVVYSAI